MTVEFGLAEERIIKKLERLNEKLRGINVATDIDNTEVATSAGGILLVNRRFGTNFTLDDLTYDFAIVDLIRRYLSEVKDPRRLATDIWNSGENLRNASPTPGALIISKFLSENGVDHIHRITSRPGNKRKETISWYKAKMPWVDKSLIHIQPDGDEVNTRFKVDQIGELGIDLFFEDAVEHAEKIAAETKATTVLVPQRWNENCKSRVGDRIVVVPDQFCKTQPAFVRAYLYMAEVFI